MVEPSSLKHQKRLLQSMMPSAEIKQELAFNSKESYFWSTFATSSPTQSKPKLSQMWRGAESCSDASNVISLFPADVVKFQ